MPKTSRPPIPCDRCGGKMFYYEDEIEARGYNCINCGHTKYLGQIVDRYPRVMLVKDYQDDKR